MRREGYELSIGKPHVILHEHDGVTEEPFEILVIEVPHDRAGRRSWKWSAPAADRWSKCTTAASLPMSRFRFRPAA